jgi:hypothetical protein
MAQQFCDCDHSWWLHDNTGCHQKGCECEHFTQARQHG